MLHRKSRTAARAVVTSTGAVTISALALFTASPGKAGVNEFTLAGPEGGWISQVQFHPTNPSIVFAVTGGGYYRSTDAGLNWSLVGGNLDLQFAPVDLAVDPSNPNRVLVAAPGQSPLISTDGGATLAYTGAFPFAPADVRHVEFSADGSVVYAASGVRIVRSTNGGLNWTERTPVTANSQSSLHVLRVDPLDEQTLYAVDLNDGGFRSTDGGATWQPLPALPDDVADMAISRTAPQEIWAATYGGGLQRSTDAGATWNSVSFAAASVTAIALDPQEESVLYVSVNRQGVLRTSNGGNDWFNVTGNASVGLANSIAVDPVDPTRVMFGGPSGIVVGTPATAAAGGVYERRNRGISAAGVHAAYVSNGSGRVYLSTDNAGVHFLAPGGAITPVDNEALQQLQPNATQSTTFGLLAQSRGSERLFVGMGHGYARSDDGGDTWQLGSVVGGLNNTVLHFADSPDNPDLIIASTAQSLHRSINGGDTWSPVSTGLPAQARTTALTFSPAAPDTVFAGVEDSGANPRGVYKSINGGVSWSPANAGFESSNIRGVAVHPEDAQIVYAAADANGLLKSMNGGETWTRIDWPDGPGNTLAVALDPELPDIVYAAGFNVVARSVDAGTTWQIVRADDARPDWIIGGLLADPNRPSTLLALTHSYGVAEITIAPNLVLETTGSITNPVAPGAQQTYQYRLRNAGAFHATGVRAIVTLPSDATGVSATTTQGACAIQASTVTCTTPVLEGAAAADIVVRATHPSVGTVEVVASATGDQPDSQSSNNEVRQSVTIAQPSTPPPPPPGGGGGGGGSSGGGNSGGGSSSGGGGGSNSLLALLGLAMLRVVHVLAARRSVSRLMSDGPVG